jgi:hypothetical protein
LKLWHKNKRRELGSTILPRSASASVERPQQRRLSLREFVVHVAVCEQPWHGHGDPRAGVRTLSPSSDNFGHTSTRAIAFCGSEAIIGRSESACNVQLFGDTTVSRRHVRVVFNGQTENWYVSQVPEHPPTNTPYVGELPVGPNDAVSYDDGTSVRLGETVVRLHLHRAGHVRPPELKSVLFDDDGFIRTTILHTWTLAECGSAGMDHSGDTRWLCGLDVDRSRSLMAGVPPVDQARVLHEIRWSMWRCLMTTVEHLDGIDVWEPAGGRDAVFAVLATATREVAVQIVERWRDAAEAHLRERGVMISISAALVPIRAMAPTSKRMVPPPLERLEHKLREAKLAGGGRAAVAPTDCVFDRTALEAWYEAASGYDELVAVVPQSSTVAAQARAAVCGTLSARTAEGAYRVAWHSGGVLLLATSGVPGDPSALLSGVPGSCVRARVADLRDIRAWAESHIDRVDSRPSLPMDGDAVLLEIRRSLETRLPGDREQYAKHALESGLQYIACIALATVLDLVQSDERTGIRGPNLTAGEAIAEAFRTARGAGAWLRVIRAAAGAKTLGTQPAALVFWSKAWEKETERIVGLRNGVSHDVRTAAHERRLAREVSEWLHRTAECLAQSVSVVHVNSSESERDPNYRAVSRRELRGAFAGEYASVREPALGTMWRGVWAESPTGRAAISPCIEIEPGERGGEPRILLLSAWPKAAGGDWQCEYRNAVTGERDARRQTFFPGIAIIESAFSASITVSGLRPAVPGADEGESQLIDLNAVLARTEEP